ncbi:MAG: T9SS type A sorting domain-containing protein [Candidatus Cloacimonetes bacterium]|nr:T9SS type A sorting domain-containing protein [Candidatus Cloacimonadota bacterium]
MNRTILIFVFITFLTISFAVNIDIIGNTVKISGNFAELNISDKTVNEETFITLQSSECKNSGMYGAPELPVYSKLLQLPDTGNYRVKNVSYDFNIIDLDKPLIAVGQSEMKESEYWEQKDEWFPSEIIKINDPNIMGAYRFSQIAIRPVQYNSAKDQIKILKNIDIELIFDESITKNTKTKRHNANTFSDLANASLLINRTGETEQNGKYLFIVLDETASLLDPLLRWKEKLGYKTVVATLSETGPTADNIKDFIFDAYHNWEVPPQYVILIGDVDGAITIPSFYVEGYYTPWDVSDHNYSLLEGDDYFPDVFVGRLSARSTLELNTIISKIINYERNPLISGNWQNKALMMSYVDEWMEYYSARETVMEVRDKLLNFEFAVVDTFISPYQSGTNILANMISSGYTFLNYRGAGGPGYWWGNYGPLFDVYSIGTLTNGFKLPMVTSITCGGGNFADNSYPTCFGEKWLTAGSPSDPKGAIGFIGPSEIDTKTWFNNTNDMGIYQGITQEGITRCGEMMLRGKMELYNNFPECHGWGNSLNSDQFYFYVYNLLGDPGLQVLTDVPDVFDMTFPDEIPANSNHLSIQIESSELDKSSYTVAVTNSDSLITIGTTTASGNAIIPINLEAGIYEITASKYMFVPVTYEMNVVDSAIVTLEDYNYSDTAPGQIVTITATVRNLASEQVNELQLELISENDLITIISGDNFLSSLPAGETFTCDFEIELDNSWIDGLRGDIFLNLTSDLGISSFFMPIGLLSPLFTVSEIMVIEPNGYLLQNTISSLDFEFLNTGSLTADETTIQLLSLSPNFEVITGEVQCLSLNAGQNGWISNPFEIEVADVISGELAKFKLLVSNGSDIYQEILYSYPIGIISEESPTFSDYGYIAIESSDTGNFTAPDYNWYEIDPTYGGDGNLVSGGHVTGNDGFTKTIELPFEFQYFGLTYNEISICSNGWIAMGDYDQVFFRNKNIPSGVGPAAMIAPFWDNLINGNIYSHFDDSEDVFIVEWSNCRNYQSYSYETFQVIFYDPVQYPTITGDGDILFQYKQIYNNDQADNYATIGIENETQTSGLLITFADIYPVTAHEISSETSILFTTNSSSQVSSDDITLSNAPKLLQNYPNPFNPTTTISFELNSTDIDNAELIIYNIKGQKVREFDLKTSGGFTESVVWNGDDKTGDQVSSGVYFYQLVIDNKTFDTRKCILIK